MLILTRRYSESIVIDERIILKILGINGHIVRLGFDAPSDVVIHRSEIAERIKSGAPITQSLTSKDDVYWSACS